MRFCWISTHFSKAVRALRYSLFLKSVCMISCRVFGSCGDYKKERKSITEELEAQISSAKSRNCTRRAKGPRKRKRWRRRRKRDSEKDLEEDDGCDLFRASLRICGSVVDLYNCSMNSSASCWGDLGFEVDVLWVRTEVCFNKRLRCGPGRACETPVAR